MDVNGCLMFACAPPGLLLHLEEIKTALPVLVHAVSGRSAYA